MGFFHRHSECDAIESKCYRNSTMTSNFLSRSHRSTGQDSHVEEDLWEALEALLRCVKEGIGVASGFGDAVVLGLGDPGFVDRFRDLTAGTHL